MADAIEGVMRALLTDLRDKFGSHVGDPARDITLISSSEPLEISRAPQIIITDLAIPVSRFRSYGSIYMNEDRESGTYDEVSYPAYHDIEFTVSVVATEHWAAWRMMEDMSVYFSQHPPTLEATWGEGEDAYTREFMKGMASDFADRTAPNEGRLKICEGRARIIGVPVYDGQMRHGKLATKVEAGITDRDGGGKIADVTVEAG